MTRVPRPRRGHHDGRTGEPMVLDLGMLSWPIASADPPTAVTSRPGAPLHCRLHLWHRYRMVRAPGVDAYAACSECGQLAPMTIFEPVVPTR